MNTGMGGMGGMGFGGMGAAGNGSQDGELGSSFGMNTAMHNNVAVQQPPQVTTHHVKRCDTNNGVRPAAIMASRGNSEYIFGFLMKFGIFCGRTRDF